MMAPPDARNSRDREHSLPLLLVAILACAVVGCDGSSSFETAYPPCVESVWTTGHAGDVLVTYDLADSEGDSAGISLHYRGAATGFVWLPATFSGAWQAVPPGLGRTLTWHSATDLPGASADDVQVMVQAYDGELGEPVVSNPFRLENGAPLLVPPAGTAPVIGGVRPYEGCAGIVLEYDLLDSERSWCQVLVEYRGGGAGGFFRPATVSGQTTGVIPNHYNAVRSITWRAWQDEPGVWAQDYQLRVTPFDGSWGAGVVTREFAIHNP